MEMGIILMDMMLTIGGMMQGDIELSSDTDFVFETGIKFRGNVTYSPLKFLVVLTDLGGIRFGIKNKGFWSVDNIDNVFEIGAGVW